MPDIKFKKKDLKRLLDFPVPFEMDLPWGEYEFSRRFYDIVNFWGIPTEKEIAFLKSFIKLKDWRLLDLACGGGRHSLGLAAEGYKITAIDIGRYPVEYAREKARQDNLEVEFIVSDIREMKYDAEYNLAFLICGQMGHFSPEESLKIFGNVSRALVDDGIFIMHLPSFKKEDMTNTTHWYQEKKPFYFQNPSIVHREQYYFAEERIKLIRDFAIDQVTRQNHLFGISEKHYLSAEIEKIADESGMRIIGKYGDYEKAPMTSRSPENIYVLTRN